MGVREWALERGRLYSIGMSHVSWGPKEAMHARCESPFGYAPYLATVYRHEEADDPPGKGCMCGLWAYYDRSLKQRLTQRVVTGWCLVEGVMAAQGRIILHDYGFRAEKARIEALIFQGNKLLSPLRYWRLRRLAKRYGLCVIGHREAGRFMEERGVVLPAKAQLGTEYPRVTRSPWIWLEVPLILVNVWFVAMNFVDGSFGLKTLFSGACALFCFWMLKWSRGW